MLRRILFKPGWPIQPGLPFRCIPSVPSSRSLSKTLPIQTLPASIRRYPSRAIPRHYYSTASGDEKDGASNTEKVDAAPTEENGTAEKPEVVEEALSKELEEKNKEVIDLKDRYLRSVADFRNLQERTKREIESARAYGIQKFAADLIESIDNFERALGAVPPDSLTAPQEVNKDLHDLFHGLKMTENILMATLKKHGLERFDPSEPTNSGKPQKFDPRIHEATFMTKSEGKDDGDIIYTQSKGFSLNGRVLRAAKVGVVKNS